MWAAGLRREEMGRAALDDPASTHYWKQCQPLRSFWLPENVQQSFSQCLHGGRGQGG